MAAGVHWLPGDTDTGIAQIDALRLNARETIARAHAFHSELDRRAAAEAGLLAAHSAQLIVSDAPALACLAAARAGIPSVVCANFTWDWIYEAYVDVVPEAAALVGELGALYARAEAGWRMPMHGGFSSIARVIDLPLVVRPRRTDMTTAQQRDALGLPRDRPLALVSFGGCGLHDLPLHRLDCLRTWGVVVTAEDRRIGGLPSGVHGISEEQLYAGGRRYEDLIGAVDVVITKPGYGIIADCVAQRTAMLYTARGKFREYDVLVREMPRFLRCRFLEMDAFLSGRWRDGLDRLAAQPPASEVAPRTDGAQIVADLILARLDATLVTPVAST